MHRVAVYGSLKKGFGNHRLLEGSTFVGRSSTPGTMYSLGGFPGVRLGGDNETSIAVEVYEVNDATLQRLDMLEGYDERRDKDDNFYNRETVKLNKLDGEPTEMDVYIYELSQSYRTNNLRLVESGVW